MEGRFGYVVLTARYFYVTALVHLTKDFDDLIYSVSFLFHVSGRVLPARVSFLMAQFSEVRSYALGEGVLEDYVQAFAWYNIATANGNELAKKGKTTVAEEMTKEQIAKAQDLSTEMVKSNPRLMGD